MNERIRLLALQAGLPKYITREIGPTVIQKFAELLIRECIIICENEHYPINPDLWDEGWDGGLHAAQERMMNHFGVDE
jgi:hypothetical protein